MIAASQRVSSEARRPAKSPFARQQGRENRTEGYAPRCQENAPRRRFADIQAEGPAPAHAFFIKRCCNEGKLFE